MEGELLRRWCHDHGHGTPPDHTIVALAVALVQHRQRRQWVWQETAEGRDTIVPRRSHVQHWFHKHNDSFLHRRRPDTASQEPTTRAPTFGTRHRQSRLAFVDRPTQEVYEAFVQDVETARGHLDAGLPLPEAFRQVADPDVQIVARVYHHRGGNHTHIARKRFDFALEGELALHFYALKGRTPATHVAWSKLVARINQAAAQRRTNVASLAHVDSRVGFGTEALCTLDVEQLKRWWTKREKQVAQMLFAHEDAMDREWRACYEDLALQVWNWWWPFLKNEKDLLVARSIQYDEADQWLACWNGDREKAQHVLEFAHRAPYSEPMFYVQALWTHFAREYMALADWLRLHPERVAAANTLWEQQLIQHLLHAPEEEARARGILERAETAPQEADRYMLTRWAATITNHMPDWYRSVLVPPSTGTFCDADIHRRVVTQCVIAELAGRLVTVSDWVRFCQTCTGNTKGQCKGSTESASPASQPLGGPVFAHHVSRERILTLLAVLAYVHRDLLVRAAQSLGKYPPSPAQMNAWHERLKNWLVRGSVQQQEAASQLGTQSTSDLLSCLV